MYAWWKIEFWFFNDKLIKTKYANCPLEAYEEAKANCSRLGPENILQLRQDATQHIART